MTGNPTRETRGPNDCFYCGRPVKLQGVMGDPEMAVFVNSAPHAASGGTMVPAHARCSPFARLTLVDQQELDRLRGWLRYIAQASNDEGSCAQRALAGDVVPPGACDEAPAQS